MLAEDVRTVVIDRAGLQALLEALAERGYTVIAPTVRDGAIVYDEVDAVELVINADYAASDVPVPSGLGPKSNKVRLVK